MSTIAERLRLTRGSQAQKEFASTIGLKQTTYGKYERGVTSPSTETASLICQKLGLNPRWLILGEEPMYDAEASQERPRLKAKDLMNKKDNELPSDMARSLKKVRKAVQAWGQEWDRLPEWAKEEFEELYGQVETLTIERDEAIAALLRAKDEAIQALKSKGEISIQPADVLRLAQALKAAGALEFPEKFPEVNVEGLRKFLDRQQQEK